MDTHERTELPSVFKIQLSNPRSKVDRDEDASTLGEAIESLFPMDNEFALLIWNYVFVPLSYAADISEMIDDCLEMVEVLASAGPQTYEVHWPSSSFLAVWQIVTDGTRVRIVATWHTVIGSLEGLLNARNEVDVGLDDFLGQWRRLFAFLQARLERAGYDRATVEGFDRLVQAAGEAVPPA